MKMNRKLSNPLIALIGIQLIWVVMVISWIYWFIGRSKEFRNLALRYKPELLTQGMEWIVLVEGLLMAIAILAGVYIIFLYWRRQAKLYLQQRSYISQLTHELKSPLASIQLHLETVKMRDLPKEKLDGFIDTMLADTERLNVLTSNLLMATRIEFRQLSDKAKKIDFSEFVTNYLQGKSSDLPEGGKLTLEVEPNINATIDVEGMEMALRNLFENALLYSPVSPEIRVSLKRSVSGRQCLIEFQDNGKGLKKNELEKIFDMFYRVRTPGENIRGTGLGLYIVRSVVNAHGGRISVESPGLGKGCTFHITLPLHGRQQRG
ncbi:HAMP domain-containing histidine kinase [Geomonas nitrogeniifigens]|uniref:histidine kinase n=1 Tax=Geomonas diazotrophica TaxID=2843197 RepID=A0ABX8JCS6_9BACT|nr:HAMP domain-containing sensor histidine kinase [Geomonas nitrogeniifigens]QWV96220.1 HAMP domain-containing histidine kinase [Geomonas nitrogeniifigens]QXE85287.1 HAMP domain-containing histidine kinase [Geomonas nitrogeniifigens]